MDDQLGNDLKSRIREVFDNFEDTSADEGWLLLREKYPESIKRRPVAWLWWSSAAAVLLLFVGIWFFQTNTIEKKQVAGYNKQLPHILTPKKEGHENRNEIKVRNNTDSSVADTRAEQLAKVNKKPVRDDKNKTNAASVNEKLATNTPKLQPALKNNRNDALAANQSPLTATKQNSTDLKYPLPDEKPAADKIIASNPVKSPDKVTPQKSNSIVKVDSGSNIPVSILAANKPQSIDMAKEQSKNSAKTLFSDDNGQPVKMQEKGYRTVNFGLYAGSYFNYAKGSNNQVNLGAGISSDIRLSNRFKLSTGVYIGQNRLGYGGIEQALNIPTTMISTGSTVSYAPAAFAGNTLQPTTSTTSTIINKITTPTITHSNADLVGLEVPVNLKYMFNPKKQNTYVSIGFSSGTFINETYNYGINYYPSVFSTNVTQSQNQSTHQSFNSFYFAKTLNFSFGTGYSIGGTKLIIEPFVKYPLDGLGSQQIKFGAGGVNLRFNLER